MAEVAVFRVMMMIDITEWGCGSWYWFCNGVLEAGVAYWMLLPMLVWLWYSERRLRMERNNEESMDVLSRGGLRHCQLMPHLDCTVLYVI